MWEPVGPLPASVYRRRRWLAVVSTVVAVLLIAWTVTAISAPGTPSENTTTRASRAALTAPQQAFPAAPSAGSAAPSPAASSQPAAEGPLFVVPGASPSPVPPSVVAEQTTPGVPATTSEELRPDDTPRPSVPVPSPVPVPPTGPVPCTNEMLGVAAEIDRAEHRVGERPVLRLVVTNISDQPCVRDLDSSRQEIVVWNQDISTRLWSSNDCVNVGSVDLRTLVPGRPVAFAVTWAGRTTKPGCPKSRTVVPAGPYNVMTRVDDDISAPTPFTRLP